MIYAIIEDITPIKLAIVLLIVLVIFGPKRLPQLGRQLGAGMREFKNSISGRDKRSSDEDLDGYEEEEDDRSSDSDGKSSRGANVDAEPRQLPPVTVPSESPIVASAASGVKGDHAMATPGAHGDKDDRTTVTAAREDEDDRAMVTSAVGRDNNRRSPDKSRQDTSDRRPPSKPQAQ